jgi:hypothetical protein
MERPVRPEGPATPATPHSISPDLLSREYEDHLDWLENQRRSRGRGTGARAFFGLAAVFVSAFAFAGAFFRRRGGDEQP